VPELPEVETVRRQLEPLIVGTRITGCRAHPSPRFRDASLATGHRIHQINRRGKYLLVGLHMSAAADPVPTQELVIHLGMTGGVSVGDSPPDDPYLRACWSLGDGRYMAFRDIRRFGRLAVVAAGEYSLLPTLHRLGPEPFDPSLDGVAFHSALSASRRHVKTNLLSQRPIAGVGNIYADEALWRARINPAARRVGRERAAVLLDSIRAVLGEALANNGTTLRDYRTPDGESGRNQERLDCYGRGGQPCRACGAALATRQLDQRTTTWCRSCQAR
jgi:formamidopyrimidine-DNA glycosylase